MKTKIIAYVIFFVSIQFTALGQQKLPDSNYTGILRDTGANGKWIKETPYKNGKVNGIVKEYSYGKLMQETSYSNNQRDGIEKRYFWGDSIVSYETNYTNGKKNGFYKDYYPSGKLRAEAYFIDGEVVDKNDTMEKVYYGNGKLQEVLFTDSHKEKIKRAYYESGALEDEWLPYDNHTMFVEKGYYENGNRQMEVTVKNKIEVIKKYDEKGNLVSQSSEIYSNTSTPSQPIQ